MTTPVLAFICFEDPSALNKVRVSLVLLEAPRNGAGTLSLEYVRGQRQSRFHQSSIRLLVDVRSSSGSGSCERF